MIRPTAAAAVYLCVAPTDLRKQAASLALLVEQSLKRDVFAAALYAFSNARRDRIRILYWGFHADRWVFGDASAAGAGDF
jgi:transposase